MTLVHDCDLDGHMDGQVKQNTFMWTVADCLALDLSLSMAMRGSCNSRPGCCERPGAACCGQAMQHSVCRHLTATSPVLPNFRLLPVLSNKQCILPLLPL